MPATPAPRSVARRRAYDVVLYGASGFVGRQTVAYLASRKHPQGRELRWALAGRNPEKLEQARQAAGPGAAQTAIVVAPADDVRALDKLARQATVVRPSGAVTHATAAAWERVVAASTDGNSL